MADDQRAGPSAPLPPTRAPSPSPSLATAADKCRRDEWSEGGVVSLLEAYESKWRLRNRAKLKGADWEEIARLVSGRSSGSRATKTPSQCKNKIESMKKRYRAESAAAAAATGGQLLERGSSWQFYGRMEVLLKGAAGEGAVNAVCSVPPAVSTKPVDGEQLAPESRKVEVDLEVDLAGNMMDGGNGSNTLPDINEDNNDDAVPTNNNDGKQGEGSGGVSDTAAATRLRRTTNRRRRRSVSRSSPGFGREVAESIRVLASSMLQIEQGRMEMCRELERMRVEADIKRGQMELRRVEIIADAQLRIARIFSRAAPGGKRRRSRSPSRSVSERSTTAASVGEDS